MKYSPFWFYLCLYLLPTTAWGKVHVLDWTISGVSLFLNSPLEVQLGDMLVLRCVLGSYSNVIYQHNETQYHECNSHGSSKVQGSCKGNTVHNISIPITQSAEDLGALLNYSPGSVAYYTSYSNGLNYSSALTDQSNGGECLKDLKLAVRISSPVTTGPPTTPTAFKQTTTDEVELLITVEPDENLPGVIGGLGVNGSPCTSCSPVTFILLLVSIILQLLMVR